MSVNIQQADKTLKKVADTTVVNKSTVIGALEYTPVTPTELNTAKTDLTNSINTAKTDLTNSIGEVSSNLSTTANNLQQQIDALEGSAFDGDYNKLTNAPILNDADGTATFADEAGNIIARIDNNGLETTNLNLHGDIELADKKLEIIDETGNIVLCIDDNGVKTAITEELKEQVDNNKTAINTKAPINSPTFTGIPKAPTPEEGANAEQVATVGYVAGAVAGLQEDIGDVFEFNDDGALTIADEQGNILAQFAVEEDAEGSVIETGLRVTDVATNSINSLNTEISNINTKIDNRINAANSATADDIVLFTDTHNIKDSGKKIVTAIDDANIPTGEAVKDYVSEEIASYDENANATISQTYATKTELDNKATELSGATAAVATDLEEHITETDGRGKLHITAAERTAWDAAKDYNNLENKPIEQDGNDKEFIITYNDENHIMARINDTGLRVLDVEIGPEGSSTTLSTKFSNIDTELDNRYTETETDQKIAEAIANADHLKREIVEKEDGLPETGEPNIIYMLKAEENEESNQDIYDEYMYINNAWERLGSWQTDLSNYITIDNATTIHNTLQSSIDGKLAKDASITLKGDVSGTASFNDNKVEITTTVADDSHNHIISNVDGLQDALNAKIDDTEFDNHVTNYNTFKDDFDSKFNLNLGEGSLEIVDDPEKTGSNTQNILARFDSEGLTTVGATFTNPITVGEPEADTDAATKKYVDDKVTPFVITVDENGIADKTYGEVSKAIENGYENIIIRQITKEYQEFREYRYCGTDKNLVDISYVFSCVLTQSPSGFMNSETSICTCSFSIANDQDLTELVKIYFKNFIPSPQKVTIQVENDGIANKTYREINSMIKNTGGGKIVIAQKTDSIDLGGLIFTNLRNYEQNRSYIDFDTENNVLRGTIYKFSCTENDTIYNCVLTIPNPSDETYDNYAVVTFNEESISSKMDKENPTGTGAFSLNRKDGSAVGDYSFAEGYDATASSYTSHAEGYNTTSNGISSHAEGHHTDAIGNYSHAEGSDSTANGFSSHAEGASTIADGWNSHAEGDTTNAKGYASHAEGSDTIAAALNQHVQGMFNIEDAIDDGRLRGKYVHIVGNGTAGDARSNAHTLDWDGNAWFAGDVYTGSTSGTDKDDGSKKLATEEYVDNAVSSFSSKVFQIAASTDENLNTNLFLLDSADDMILKYYDENTTSWVPVTIGWG